MKIENIIKDEKGLIRICYMEADVKYVRFCDHIDWLPDEIADVMSSFNPSEINPNALKSDFIPIEMVEYLTLKYL